MQYVTHKLFWQRQQVGYTGATSGLTATPERRLLARVSMAAPGMAVLAWLFAHRNVT